MKQRLHLVAISGHNLVIWILNEDACTPAEPGKQYPPTGMIFPASGLIDH